MELLERAIERAHALGATKVRLHVLAQNNPIRTEVFYRGASIFLYCVCWSPARYMDMPSADV